MLFSFIFGLVNSVRDTYTGENDSKLWKGRERQAGPKAEGRRRRRLSALEASGASAILEGVS